jgi:hypothetical protein
MKIGILTHYQISNHGGMLQMYGLSQILKKLGGHEIEILRFNRNFDFVEKGFPSQYNLSLKYFPVYLSYFLKFGLARTLFNFKKNLLLQKFRRENFILSDIYHRQTNLDAVCIGSDEVFSLEAGVNPIMYSHSLNVSLIFSYAPSFGQTDIGLIKEKGCFELIKSGLNRFNFLSVRDETSADAVKTLTGKYPEILFDPVLIYGFIKERNYESGKIPKIPYLLVYSYDINLNSEEEIRSIKLYAKKRNLKIISAAYYHKWCDYNLNLSPLELLLAFKNAECVITDTFHGSVLSILLNKPFAVFTRKINENKISCLLKSLKAEQAKLQNWEMIEKTISYRLDWNEINKTLENERAKSYAYLNKALSNAK